MEDQCASLKSKGIKASMLNSNYSKKQQDIILDNAIYGDTQFMFMSPERIQSRLFQERVQKMNVGMIVIDEAHCISEWGHDFRPEYRKLIDLRSLCPNATFLALTATATEKTRKDIVENLEMDDCNSIITSPIRQNLKYQIHEVEEKKHYLLNAIESRTSSIVYVGSRKATHELSHYLTNSGKNALPYHGAMDRYEKEDTYHKWYNGTVMSVVATNAFGMGIDKSDVKQVFHWTIPESLEAYVQEAGRAGRDGLEAKAIMLINNYDIKRHQEKLHNVFPNLKYLRNLYGNLARFLEAGVGPIEEDWFDFDINQFAKANEYNKFRLMNALKLLERLELIKLSDAFSKPSKLSFDESEMRMFLSDKSVSEKMKEFIRLCLRSYEGLYYAPTTINEASLAKKFGQNENKIRQALQWIDGRNLGKYKPQFSGYQLAFVDYRYNSKNLPFNESLFNQLKGRFELGLNSILDYVHTKECRQIFIARYFGFKESPCGKCDNCEMKAVQTEDLTWLQHTIIQKINAEDQLLSDLINGYDTQYQSRVVSILRKMEQEEMIIIDNDKVRKS